MLIQMNPR